MIYFLCSRRIAISFAIFIGLSCTKANAKSYTGPEKRVVIIFENIPSFQRSAFPFPGFQITNNRFQVTVFDDFHQHYFNPAPNTLDTFEMAPKNNHIILSMLYEMNHQPIEFVITANDTVTIKFRNGLPYAVSKLSVNDQVLNYEYYRRLNQDSSGVTPYDIYQNPVLVAKNVNEFIFDEPIKSGWYKPAGEYLKKEMSFLNDSSELKQISPITFSFFQEKFFYQLSTIDFEQKKLPADSLRTVLQRNKERTPTLSYSYFLPLLEAVSDSINVRSAKVLKGKTSSIIDYREVYENAEKWAAVNEFYRKQLLYKYLREVGKTFSKSDLTRYLSKFKAFSGDSIIVENIQNEFLISDQATQQNSSALLLLDSKMSKYHFRNY